MRQKLITEVEAFKKRTGLSDHRVGFLLAKNGRLLDRLRAERPIEIDTVERIRANLRAETAKRFPKEQGAA
ncbi:hypothetical protein [Falsirhodobacter sp. 1013]|uniref:hypothetical protein n=1 Tax=Falsirhodobacter sp. 1013 TaxID=3417566 RepID=UPI003EB868D7